MPLATPMTSTPSAAKDNDLATVTTEADVESPMTTTSTKGTSMKTKRTINLFWIVLASFVAGVVVTLSVVLVSKNRDDSNKKAMTGSSEAIIEKDDPNLPPYWNVKSVFVVDDEDNVSGEQCIVDPVDPHCILSHTAAGWGTTQSYADGDVTCIFQVLQEGYGLHMDLFDTVLGQDKLTIHEFKYSGKGLRFDGYPVEAGDVLKWDSDSGPDPKGADTVRAGWRICLVPM